MALGTERRGLPGGRRCAWLAGLWLWLGLAAAAWAQSPVTLPGGALPNGVVGQAYSYGVAASGGSPPYTYAVTGSLPSGLAMDAGGVVSGTPDTEGTYSFAITATDSASGSFTAAYTMDVVPAPTIVPATLPDGVVGQEYTQYMTVANGSGAYHFSLESGSLPPGLTIDTGGTLTGTPTAEGYYAFQLRAEPASLPSFAPTAVVVAAGTIIQDFMIDVDAAAPTITLSPASLPAGTVGDAYSATITASGGVAPYTYAVSSGGLPSGLTLDPATGVISGTPDEDFLYTFDITATDANDDTGTATYSIEILAPTLSLSPATLPDGVVGQAYAATVTVVGAGSPPYVFDVASGALPPGLVLDPASGAISGSPSETGSYGFTLEATDFAERVASRSYTVDVTDAPLPTVAAHHATTHAGVPVQVVLTDGASGGPFTGANVESVWPVDAGTATVVQDGGDYVLTFTPAEGFTGTAKVCYTLENAAGSSSPGIVTIDVAPLANPLADAEVMGLLQSQAAVAQVFAQAQVANVVERLERLQAPATQEWGFWVAGVFRRGDLDATGQAEGLAFETSGVTTGADRRFGERFTFGIATGLGQDRTLVGSHGSRNDSRAHAAMAYGSFRAPDSPFFVNAMHGHQRLSFQLRRFVPGGIAPAGAGGTLQALANSLQPLAGSGDTLDSERTGGQDYSSLGAGYRHEGKAWTFTSYGRQDDVRTDLDPYTEPGGSADALHYEGQSLRTRTSILGFRVDGKREIRWGTLLPKLKVELQHDANDQGMVEVRYANLSNGPTYRAEPPGFDSRRVALELGTTLVTRKLLTLRLEYHAMLGGIYRNDNAIVFSLQKEH